MTIDNLTRREFLGLGIAAGAGLLVPELVFGGGQKLTPTQEENLERYGYPWEKVLDRSILHGSSSDEYIHRFFAKEFIQLYKNDSKVRNAFNFPSIMDKYLAQISNGDNNDGELVGVLLSRHGNINFTVKMQEKPYKDKEGLFHGFYMGVERLSSADYKYLARQAKD